ncbi:hypothetical protein SEA_CHISANAKITSUNE_112 [Gordonia phage ChisanaKitsune]|uniref:HNH endonuclease n=1 Tax=Gordonia phage ChisanaKitsune TaxID=2871538 RepID=A0AAE8BXA5_9CAUD|nr:HNH endonuclease [Gordonia phage ChisanaKitsune]QZE10899.1 hypothetical protein SEA_CHISANAKITSUNE_112 [Gordonia phage ChisanaKitsune]
MKCVNPWHVRPVTQKENVLRSEIAIAAVNARKTHCDHGHEFTPENTYEYRGKRHCRVCQRKRSREYKRSH